MIVLEKVGSLIGQAKVAAGDRVVYEFARAQSIDGWWIWAALVAGIVLAMGLCVFFYRRDVSELARPVRWTLIGLRLVAIAALVFIFLDLVRRTQRRVTRPSEVVVLIDTSQSMSLPSDASPDSPTRADVAARLLEEANLAERFSQEHRTSVYVFDQLSEPRLLQTTFKGSGSGERELSDAGQRAGTSVEAASETTSSGESAIRNTNSGTKRTGQSVVHPFVLFGAFCLGIAAIAAMVSLVIGGLTGKRRRAKSRVHRWETLPPEEASGRDHVIGWALMVAALTLVVGIVFLGSVYATRTDQTLLSILGLDQPDDATSESDADSGAPQDDPQEPTDRTPRPLPQEVRDWQEALLASGAQSRIGDAIRAVLVDHDPTTLAGLVLITDGQNNGGAAISSALTLARRGEVSVYPIGLGSSQPPTNVRVVDLEAPRRVYPGDKFAVSAVLQATGQNDLKVDVELIDALDDGASNEAASASAGRIEQPMESTSLEGGQVLDRQSVTLQADATLAGVRFEIQPESVGRRRLAVRVVAPPEDRNRADDMQTARYEVVARKLRVLAIAGGPTREYRFVRNLLYRDDSVELDVWLQTGQSGMSQDADRLLRNFPATAQSLFDYDAILMFDPDWSAIDSASLELIDQFLTQQAGGLVLVAGPVYHPRLSRDRADDRTSQIRGFFPVNLATRGPLLGGGRQGGETPWPLKWTDEALRAEFLWIADQPQASFQRWQDFSGVYDFVGVKSAKPGAKVYAYFSDPTTEISGSLPVFMASQFYGAGRVFFQGSGEMWRLRSAGDRFFNAYYTKLVRWVSEGRLLRDSKRGVLLADTSRAMVGQTVTLRAVLVDDQFQPLTEPSVTAKLLTPDGRIKDLSLMPAADVAQGGTYTGNFVATAAGNYDIELTVGEALEEQILRQAVQVRLPTSELEQPRRADDALAQLAAASRGEYFPLRETTDLVAVAEQLDATIAPQPQVTLLSGTPDSTFNLRRNAVLMWLMASVLTFEWLVRRLHKLA